MLRSLSARRRVPLLKHILRNARNSTTPNVSHCVSMPKIRAVSSRGGVSFFSSSATSDDEGDDGAFVSNVTIDTDDDSIFANSDTNTNDTSGPNLHGRIYVALNDGLDDVTSLEIIDLREEHGRLGMVVVSNDFEGRPLREREAMLRRILSDTVDAEELKTSYAFETLTEYEWARIINLPTDEELNQQINQVFEDRGHFNLSEEDIDLLVNAPDDFDDDEDRVLDELTIPPEFDDSENDEISKEVLRRLEEQDKRNGAQRSTDGTDCNNNNNNNDNDNDNDNDNNNSDDDDGFTFSSSPRDDAQFQKEFLKLQKAYNEKIERQQEIADLKNAALQRQQSINRDTSNNSDDDIQVVSHGSASASSVHRGNSNTNSSARSKTAVLDTEVDFDIKDFDDDEEYEDWDENDFEASGAKMDVDETEKEKLETEAFDLELKAEEKEEDRIEEELLRLEEQAQAMLDEKESQRLKQLRAKQRQNRNKYDPAELWTVKREAKTREEHDEEVDGEWIDFIDKKARYARKKQSLLDTYTPEKRAEMKKQGPQILDLTKKPEPRFADRKPKPIRVGGGEGTDSDDGTTVESEYDLDAEVHTVFGGIPMHDRTLNDEAFVIRPAPNQDIYDIIPDYNVKLKKLRALKRKQQQEEKKERRERREEK